MKKIFCLVMICLMSTSVAFSAISNSEMYEATYMKNQGYSKETIRLANDQVFSPHKDKFADSKKTHFKKMWDKLNYLFDPAHDSGEFGNKDIDFTNRWDEN